MNKVSQLMEEIGPVTPVIDAVIELDEDTWGITCGGESLQLIAQIEAEADLLHLEAEIGRPSSDKTAQVYESLLLFNTAPQSAGGIRMGLAEPNGEVVQVCDLSLSQLELLELQHAIEDFVLKATLWESMLIMGPDQTDAGEDAEAHEEETPPDNDAIRV